MKLDASDILVLHNLVVMGFMYECMIQDWQAFNEGLTGRDAGHLKLFVKSLVQSSSLCVNIVTIQRYLAT